VRGRGVLVQDSGRLSTATAVLAAKVKDRDGVLTDVASEGDAIVDRLNAVMSHSSNCSLL
jgi:hypothetical protein